MNIKVPRSRGLDEHSCSLVIDRDADVLTGTELVNFLYTRFADAISATRGRGAGEVAAA